VDYEDYDEDQAEDEGPLCPECDVPVDLEGKLCPQCKFWADGGA
jgi:hypothetical protein